MIDKLNYEYLKSFDKNFEERWIFVNPNSEPNCSSAKVAFAIL